MRAPPQGGDLPRFAASFFPRHTRGCVRKKSLAETNPELAAQIHPDSDIKDTEVTAGSNKKPLWMCERGHTWLATVVDRFQGYGCPYCSNQKILLGFNDLTTTNPKLAKEVSPNSKIKATEVAVKSGRKLLWRCNKGHEWEARVSDRSRGRGCPYCSNRKILPGFNDLATTNPELAAQIHPDSDIKATDIADFSRIKALWRCRLDHEWEAKVADRSRGRGCPYCSNQKILPGFNDLTTTNPGLAKEVSLGSKIKATEVTASSEKKLLWRCNKGHEWEAKVADRSRGRGCPYCSNQEMLPGFNDLATTNPKLAKEVSPKSKIKATEITAGSNRKLLWRCSWGHEWEAVVASRSKGIGCPYCSNQKPIPGFNDLATTNPGLAKEISPNSRTKATALMAGSNRKLLWRCNKGHEWKARVYSRSGGQGCPYCSNQKMLPGFNDLATTNPGLAKEISPNSKIKATEITAGSNRKLLWRCNKGHEWEAAISSRSQGRGCPKCSGSKMEENLAQLIKALLPRNTRVIRNDRRLIKPYELDILVPSLSLAFEFNGTYWHSDEMVRASKPQFSSSKAFDDFKKAECEKRKVKLFFVREKPWTENHEKEVKRVERIVGAALKKAA